MMAIFSTFTSFLVALVPETHGPTLFKEKASLSREEQEKLGITKVELGERIRKVLGVYKQALKRPVLFFFTGESQLLCRVRRFANETSLLTEPIVLFISIYLSILYGIL